MGNYTMAAVFIILLNVLLFFSAEAMRSVNPSGAVCYHVEGSVIDGKIYNSGNQTTAQSGVLNDLPGAQEAVTTGSANIFTDIFNSILSSIKSIPGLSFMLSIVKAPSNIFGCLEFLPSAFVAGINVFWYLITFLALLELLWGR
jgi:hypothetical protein